MLRAVLLALCVWILLGLARTARAQDDQDYVKLDLRVTSSRPGSAEVDRGASDGLEPGDRITFVPRTGGVYLGTLTEVQERSATVKLDDPRVTPTLGTRAETRIPFARIAALEQPAPAPAAPPVVKGEPTEKAPAHPDWENQDEDWVEGEPLLARIDPVLPGDRSMQVSGRIYGSADFSGNTEGDHRSSFMRLGAEVLYQNLLGNGEHLHFQGELDYREADVPDNYDDVSETDLIIDFLSYANGGTRFDGSRWELGRFLQYGMPEFGLLDGAAWDQRLDGGNQFGLSAGWMPEPDNDQESFEDFQLALYYRWFGDQTQNLSIAGGYQKSWHDFDADRDLFVVDFYYLPLDTWRYYGTVWLDLYTAGDDDKGAGLEVTQAFLSASRRWDSGSTLALTYQHYAFPEIDRNEFTPVTGQQLANDHNDRVELDSVISVGVGADILAEIGAWTDEDDSGLDGQLGVALDDLLFNNSTWTVAGFGTDGEFVSVLGARLGFVKFVGSGSWGLGYEITHDVFAGFSNANDEMYTHRIRLGGDIVNRSGWSFAGDVEVDVFDDEWGLMLGIYIQKSF